MDLQKLVRVQDSEEVAPVKVENKDWERMQDLIDRDQDGDSVAAKIKDKRKAIARFVAGCHLEKKEPKFSEKGYYVEWGTPFRKFAEKAFELGATKEEILATYNSVQIPEGFKENHHTKKVYSGYTGSFNKLIDQMKEKYGVEISYKETKRAQNSWSYDTKRQYHSNGRVWPLNYEVTVKKGDKEITLLCILVTNEGGGMYGYDFNYQRCKNFKDFKQRFEGEIKKSFEQVKDDAAPYQTSAALQALEARLEKEGLTKELADKISEETWNLLCKEYSMLGEYIEDSEKLGNGSEDDAKICAEHLNDMGFEAGYKQEDSKWYLTLTECDDIDQAIDVAERYGFSKELENLDID